MKPHYLSIYSPFYFLTVLFCLPTLAHAANNKQPIANAGINQVAGAVTPVMLDGSLSFDPDGKLKKYQWLQIQGPKVLLTGALTPKPVSTTPTQLINRQPVPLVFKLTVTDNQNTVASDEVLITVVADKLNDTGITACASDTKAALVCPVQGYAGQDAQVGRDKTHNDNHDGHAGFSYTKISGVGKALLASAKQWRCVKDNVTGLIWELKTNDGGLHDKDWTYSWYDADKTRNGGLAGVENGGVCGDTSACDTEAYVKAVNAKGWCGAKDWRMPTKKELRSLINYSRIPSTLDTAYFTQTSADMKYWSSTPDAYEHNLAWCMLFKPINAVVVDKADQLSVRLVRNGWQ